MDSPTQPSRLPALPERPDDGHKGSFGTVIVVGGSRAMPHAPAICGRAALRAGCGLVKIAADHDVLAAALLTEPSATGVALTDPHDTRVDPLTRLDRADPEHRAVLAVGPGLGSSHERLVMSLLHGKRPVVLDADGLNLLARSGQRHAPAGAACVLTPHPGEFRRLADHARLDLDPTDPQQREGAAVALARFHAAVVVLKGHRSVVADADGGRCYVNDTGNAAMATAGSGDVLTGLIASLIAQGLGVYDAAVLGVHLHGEAGDAWAQCHGRSGLLARELADALPGAFESYRRRAQGDRI